MKRILVTYRSTHEAYFLFEKIRDLLKSRENSQIVTYINSSLNCMEITNYKAGWKIKFIMDDFSKLRGMQPDYFYTSNSDARSYFAKFGSVEVTSVNDIILLVESIEGGSTMTAREEYTEMHGLEKFCNENDIYWELSKDLSYFNGEITYTFTFRHDRTGRSIKKIYSKSEYESCHNYIECELIKLCKSEFLLLPYKSGMFYNECFRNPFITNTSLPEIKKVIFNDPATIVIWKDGSKTIVKCQDGDTFDAEKGLALAIAKKVLGTNKSKSNFNDVFKKWIED